MSEHKQAEEMSKATERFSEAVSVFVQYVERLEAARHKEPLSEEKADSVALEAVHKVREEMGREVEDHPPDSKAVEEWSQRRERSRREGRWTRWRH